MASESPTPRCTNCGHLPHKQGRCFNMASDAGCDCAAEVTCAACRAGLSTYQECTCGEVVVTGLRARVTELEAERDIAYGAAKMWGERSLAHETEKFALRSENERLRADREALTDGKVWHHIRWSKNRGWYYGDRSDVAKCNGPYLTADEALAAFRSSTAHPTPEAPLRDEWVNAAGQKVGMYGPTAHPTPET